MQKLSVIIVTFNEERNIERCLHSVQWADEIIVVDAFSTDRTVELCRRLKANVIQRAWEGYAPQKQFALSMASHAWVLLVDADEEVPPELHREIESMISTRKDCSGYEIARKSFFLGQWMKHGGWYPGYQLRLFLKVKASIPQRPVHEGVEVQGPVEKLQNPLNHYTYYSLSQYLAKLNDYTSLDVMNRLNDKRHRTRSMVQFYHQSAFRFFKNVFCSDGFQGRFSRNACLLSILLSISFCCSRKCGSIETAAQRGQPLPPVTSEALNSIKRLS